MKSIILLFTLIIFASCNVEELAPEAVGTNLADLIEGVDNPELINSTVRAQQVLEKYGCFTCHLNRSSGELDKGYAMWSRYKNKPLKWADDATLTSGRNHDFPLINLVEPENSVLVQSIRGCHTGLDFQWKNSMPTNGTEATPGECADLINWISDLAVEFPDFKDRQAANFNQEDEVDNGDEFVDQDETFQEALAVLNNKCMGCHRNLDQGSNIDGGKWENYDTQEAWANSILIDTNFGIESHLYKSLVNCDNYDPDYSQMPPVNFPQLTGPECVKLFEWVNSMEILFAN